jgi:hypothetical protein
VVGRYCARRFDVVTMQEGCERLYVVVCIVIIGAVYGSADENLLKSGGSANLLRTLAAAVTVERRLEDHRNARACLRIVAIGRQLGNRQKGKGSQGGAFGIVRHGRHLTHNPITKYIASYVRYRTVIYIVICPTAHATNACPAMLSR